MEKRIFSLLKVGWEWKWDELTITMGRDNFNYSFGTILGVSHEAIDDMLIRFGQHLEQMEQRKAYKVMPDISER